MEIIDRIEFMKIMEIYLEMCSVRLMEILFEFL